MQYLHTMTFYHNFLERKVFFTSLKICCTLFLNLRDRNEVITRIELKIGASYSLVLVVLMKHNLFLTLSYHPFPLPRIERNVRRNDALLCGWFRTTLKQRHQITPSKRALFGKYCMLVLKVQLLVS